MCLKGGKFEAVALPRRLPTTFEAAKKLRNITPVLSRRMWGEVGDRNDHPSLILKLQKSIQNVESAGIFGTGWGKAIHHLSCPEIRRKISGIIYEQD